MTVLKLTCFINKRALGILPMQNIEKVRHPASRFNKTDAIASSRILMCRMTNSVLIPFGATAGSVLTCQPLFLQYPCKCQGRDCLHIIIKTLLTLQHPWVLNYAFRNVGLREGRCSGLISYLWSLLLPPSRSCFVPWKSQQPSGLFGTLSLTRPSEVSLARPVEY